jgi:hypothetical protein
MNSRERVLLAINHQEPGRVPLDWSGKPEVSAALQALFGVRGHEELRVPERRDPLSATFSSGYHLRSAYCWLGPYSGFKGDHR